MAFSKNRKINFSIRSRIYLSFLLFVALFVLNSAVVMITLCSTRSRALHISRVIDPSLKQLNDFHDMVIHSKMYVTNWVFLGAGQKDKDALLQIHNHQYTNIKASLQQLSGKWISRENTDSLQSLIAEFEKLLLKQKAVMQLLQTPEDYTVLSKRMQAQHLVEDEIIPETDAITGALFSVRSKERLLKSQEETVLEHAFRNLWIIVVLFIVTFICISFVLSKYLSCIIVKPIRQIKTIVEGLGKGITKSIAHRQKQNEIDEMIFAINNLSEKLRYTAVFAKKIGERNFNVPFKPLSDEDTLGKALLTMRDNLKFVDESLNQAQHIARLGNWEWNAKTDKLFWSDEMYEIFEKNPSCFVPDYDGLIESIHPEDRAGIMNCINQSLQDHQPYSLECQVVTANEIKTILSRTNVGLDENGDIIKLYGTVQDISERKKSEQQIAESERRYRQIVETTQEGIWLIDEYNTVIFVNKKMCEMLGYSSEEILGKMNYEFKPEFEKQNTLDQIERRKKGISETHESIYVHKTGKLVYGQVTTNPVLDEEGRYKGALAMVTDISQRKLQEELLKKHETNLQWKNKELERKNRELEQFAYIASHDLQEPLRTITSFAGHLQKQYADKLDARGRKYLYFMQQGTERMQTLITDLLEYSRIGRKRELKSIDCNEILNNVIADLHTVIHESNVEIQTEKLPVINGYTTEIKQLFQNLITNAIKFRKKEEPPKIRICSQPIDGGWKFSVEDNGIGIDEQYNERIFVIFQRLHTRTEYEGSGIGLSHCKKIVELHGGKIWVRSKPGMGSTFHFTILENHN